MQAQIPSQIRYWNRSTQREEVERVYGDALVRFIYNTGVGRALNDLVLSRSLLSKAMGRYQSSRLSRNAIGRFIADFGIPMEEYQDTQYGSFNDFFIRKFRPGMRSFSQSPSDFSAFAEGRYLAFASITEDQTFPVKGADLSPEQILGNAEQAKSFVGGPLMICRLCPTDYHRFHFPDDGAVEEIYRVAGRYHSVNPMALRYKSEIFAINERQVSILRTRNFGKVAYVEVGAMGVGKIVQSYNGINFKRGDEKGYFLFGGSTVIVFGEPEAWRPSADLLANTAKRVETFVKLGDTVATAIVGNTNV
ncbi:MAG: phosphatidylserine decarboxylase [Bacteriovoracia bacterium]